MAIPGMATTAMSTPAATVIDELRGRRTTCSHSGCRTADSNDALPIRPGPRAAVTRSVPSGQVAASRVSLVSPAYRRPAAALLAVGCAVGALSGCRAAGNLGGEY